MCLVQVDCPFTNKENKFKLDRTAADVVTSDKKDSEK